MKRRMKTVSVRKNKYLFLCLITIELFMSFSFLGYIHIEPVSLTFVYVPVLMAGCILGAKEAAVIGAIFGLASMWKASAFYVTAGDAIFSPMISGKPVASILLSVGSRALFGFVVGLLYRAAERSKHPLLGVVVVSSLGRTIHAFLVYTFMEIFFPEAGLGISNTVNDILRWDFIPFVLIVDALVVLCYILFFRSDTVLKFLYRVQSVDRSHSFAFHNRRSTKILFLLLALVLLASFSVAIYFTNRLGIVLSHYGFDMSQRASYDVMHLQIQFLFGIISLAIIVIISIVVYQKNFNYLYYEAKLDGLTGLLGRKQFFQTGVGMLTSMEWEYGEKTGCFIILDIDHFKEINDLYGHPVGDRVLKEVAAHLKSVLGEHGILGRLGGDEFVALIHKPMRRREIEARMNILREKLQKIQLEGKTVTCSIGVIPVEKGYCIEELYQSADLLLYEAKKKGKDQFMFDSRFQAKI